MFYSNEAGTNYSYVFIEAIMKKLKLREVYYDCDVLGLLEFLVFENIVQYNRFFDKFYIYDNLDELLDKLRYGSMNLQIYLDLMTNTETTKRLYALDEIVDFVCSHIFRVLTSEVNLSEERLRAVFRECYCKVDDVNVFITPIKEELREDYLYILKHYNLDIDYPKMDREKFEKEIFKVTDLGDEYW